MPLIEAIRASAANRAVRPKGALHPITLSGGGWHNTDLGQQSFQLSDNDFTEVGDGGEVAQDSVD